MAKEKPILAGPAQSAVSGYGFLNLPTADLRATTQIGDTITRIGTAFAQGMDKAESDKQTLEADSKLLNNYAAFQTELANDPDYQSHSKKLNDFIKNQERTVVNNIRHRGARERARNQLLAYKGKWGAQVQEQAWKKEVQAIKDTAFLAIETGIDRGDMEHAEKGIQLLLDKNLVTEKGAELRRLDTRQRMAERGQEYEEEIWFRHFTINNSFTLDEALAGVEEVPGKDIGDRRSHLRTRVRAWFNSQEIEKQNAIRELDENLWNISQKADFDTYRQAVEGSSLLSPKEKDDRIKQFLDRQTMLRQGKGDPLLKTDNWDLYWDDYKKVKDGEITDEKILRSHVGSGGYTISQYKEMVNIITGETKLDVLDETLTDVIRQFDDMYNISKAEIQKLEINDKEMHKKLAKEGRYFNELKASIRQYKIDNPDATPKQLMDAADELLNPIRKDKAKAAVKKMYESYIIHTISGPVWMKREVKPKGKQADTTESQWKPGSPIDEQGKLSLDVFVKTISDLKAANRMDEAKQYYDTWKDVLK